MKNLVTEFAHLNPRSRATSKEIIELWALQTPLNPQSKFSRWWIFRVDISLARQIANNREGEERKNNLQHRLLNIVVGLAEIYDSALVVIQKNHEHAPTIMLLLDEHGKQNSIISVYEFFSAALMIYVKDFLWSFPHQTVRKMMVRSNTFNGEFIYSRKASFIISSHTALALGMARKKNMAHSSDAFYNHPHQLCSDNLFCFVC